MKNFLSPTNAVLLLVSLTACAAFFLGKLEAKDFMLLSGMVFTYFFTKPSDPTQPFGGK